MLEREIAGFVEENIDDHPLRGREDHALDQLLVLDVAQSPPTSFIRPPGSLTLKTRVLAVFVK